MLQRILLGSKLEVYGRRGVSGLGFRVLGFRVWGGGRLSSGLPALKMRTCGYVCLLWLAVGSTIGLRV